MADFGNIDDRSSECRITEIGKGNAHSANVYGPTEADEEYGSRMINDGQHSQIIRARSHLIWSDDYDDNDEKEGLKSKFSSEDEKGLKLLESLSGRLNKGYTDIGYDSGSEKALYGVSSEWLIT